MQEVVRELRTVAAGERKRLGANRIPVDIKSSRFQDYLARMESLSTVAQSLRNKFIKANLRLVVKIAHKLNHGRMPLSDLIQEGNIGLIKAVERFDHRRGFRFSTYAVWWIRHSIGRALANRGRVVRLPVHHVDLQRRISRTSSELGTKLGRAPTAEEIACGAGLPFEKVEQLLDRPPDRNVSLDRSISDEDDRSFVDLLASPGSLGPVEKIEQQSVSDVVRHLLGDLEPVEVDVLHKRFGLDGEQALTLREIGKRYNLSRERIRQIQERALHKLRRGLRQNNAI
jgi:RNA polymerase primary sigma factor